MSICEDIQRATQGTTNIQVISQTEAEEFLSGAIRGGRTDILRYADMTVQFTTSRNMTCHFLQNELCSATPDIDYCFQGGGGLEFIKPAWWNDANLEQKGNWIASMNHGEKKYNELLLQGNSPEQIVDVLPNALKTMIVQKGNIQEWRNALTHSVSRHAPPQMCQLTRALLTELQGLLPVVFNDIKF